CRQRGGDVMRHAEPIHRQLVSRRDNRDRAGRIRAAKTGRGTVRVKQPVNNGALAGAGAAEDGEDRRVLRAVIGQGKTTRGGVGRVLSLGWAVTGPSDAASIEQLPDQREYLEAGNNLLHGKGLRFFDPRFQDDMRAARMPGYPLLIAACGSSARATRVAQAFI